MTDDLDRQLVDLARWAPDAGLDLAVVAEGARRRRRRRRLTRGVPLLLVGVLAATPLVLSGDDPGVDTISPAPSTVAQGAAASGPDTVPYDPATAPAVFRERESLPSCGSFVLRNEPDRPLATPEVGTSCLRQAAISGGGAELAVSTPTLEGQPVVTYTRALVGGGFEVFHDSTRDDYGAGVWVLTRCASTSDSGTPERCGEPQRLAAATVDDGECPTGPTALADYIDFVQVGDQTYTGAGAAPVGTRLGETVLTVTCELSKGARGAREALRSGDAAFVPAGTELRQVLGFDPAFRLAVEVDGEVRLYERDAPDEPGTGHDVFPGLREHVQAVLLLSHQDGETELARIDGRAQVDQLVTDILHAPYQPSRPLDADLFLGLLLDDGSTVRRAYDTRIGVLWPGLQLPERFIQAVESARP
jgi:hypothetical protein